MIDEVRVKVEMQIEGGGIQTMRIAVPADRAESGVAHLMLAVSHEARKLMVDAGGGPKLGPNAERLMRERERGKTAKAANQGESP